MPAASPGPLLAALMVGLETTVDELHVVDELLALGLGPSSTNARTRSLSLRGVVDQKSAMCVATVSSACCCVSSGVVNSAIKRASRAGGTIGANSTTAPRALTHVVASAMPPVRVHTSSRRAPDG